MVMFGHIRGPMFRKAPDMRQPLKKPATYAIAYFFAIPFFAALYLWTPAVFYQSNFQVESAYSDHVAGVLRGLCAALNNRLADSQGKTRGERFTETVGAYSFPAL